MEYSTHDQTVSYSLNISFNIPHAYNKAEGEERRDTGMHNNLSSPITPKQNKNLTVMRPIRILQPRGNQLNILTPQIPLHLLPIFIVLSPISMHDSEFYTILVFAR